MATPGRSQAPELNLRPTLNPAPLVNVQPVAPVNRQGAGSNLINIAESLAGLSSSFARYAATQKVQNNKQEDYLAGSLSGKSYEELKTYFDQNPELLDKEKVAMMYAGKYANTFGTDLLSGKLTEDWDGQTPLDQFIATKQQEYLTQLPDDPMIRAFFNNSANPYVQNYIMGRTKQEADAQAAETVDVLKSNADNAWETAKAATGATASAPGTAERLPILTGTQPGRQPLQMKGVQGVVLDRWEQVQGVFGKQLPVVSGARDAATNAKAGGAKKSQHLEGNALDIDVSSLDYAERRRLIETASAMGFTGIGIYKNSIHLDMRKGRAIWGPTHTKESVPPWAYSATAKHVAGAIKPLPYSVNASAVAVDNIFSTVAESPQFKRMTGPQRNAFWYEYAASRPVQTEDDLKVVEGILTSQRPGGAPPLSEDPEYALRVRSLLEQRKDEFRKANIEATTPIQLQIKEAIDKGAGIAELDRIFEGAGNLISSEEKLRAKELMVEQEQKLAALNGARLAHNAAIDKVRQEGKQKFAFGAAFTGFDDVEVPDPKDPTKTTTYTGKQQMDDVKNDILNGLDKMAEEKNLPDEAKWGLIAGIFGKSNETISQWQDAFSSTVTSFNPADAAKGVTDQMVTNAKLYDYLKSSGNYLYLDAHLKGENTKQFWTMYDSFRGTGQSEKEALFSTYKVMNDSDALEVARKGVNYAEGEYWKTGGKDFVRAELNGNSPAGGQVMRMATALAATGRDPKEALDQSIQMFKDTHEYVLNSWIPKNLKGLPENFTDNIQEYVGTYIQQYGAKANPPVSDVEDVMIAPDASGSRFYLFQKSTGLPLMAKDVKGGLSRTGVLSVTLQSLRDYDKLKNDKASIQNDSNRAALSEAITQAGSPNAPTKMVGGGRAAPREVKLTPQQIVEQNKQKQDEAVAADIKKAERTNPNTLKVKEGQLKGLTDEQLRGYVDRATANPNKYLPEEWNLIKSEAKRRGWNID